MTLAEELRDANPSACLAAIDAIAASATVAPDAVDALADCLGHPSKAVQRRSAEMFATLHARGIPVEERLLALLCAVPPRDRWAAAFALAKIGSPPHEVLPVLIEHLGDADGDMRWAAAESLVRLPWRAEVVKELSALLRDGNPAQRKMAAYCLRDLQAGSLALDALLRAALDDADAGVRIAAMSALTRLGTDRRSAAQCVVARLDDEDPGVRRAAAGSLGRLGESSPEVLAALHRASHSADPSMRRAAEHSLRLLTPEAGSKGGMPL